MACRHCAGQHDRRKTVKIVTHKPARGAQILLSPLADRLLSKACDQIKAGHLGEAFRAQLHRHKGHHILHNPVRPCPTLTPEVGIIDYHLPVQNPSRFAFGRHLHELVLDPPNAWVAYTGLALEFQRRDVGFRLADQEYDLKPASQGQLRAMEERPGTQTRLCSTDLALPIADVFNIKVTVFGSAALRTLKVLRPARQFQRLLAFCFRPILLKRLRQAYAWLKLYRIHRHDRSSVRYPGDSVFYSLAHHVSLAGYSY